MSGSKKNGGDDHDRPQVDDGGHVHGPDCGCGHHHAGQEHAASGREVPGFPTEVTFKAVFRNRPYTMETLKNLCQEAGLDARISDRGSSKGNFISYTVTAMFPSDDVLKSLCSRIGQVEGFYTMF